MRSKSLSLSLGLLLLTAAASLAQSGTWTIDSAHSSARFSVRHMMISDAAGRFGMVSGTIVGDPRQPQNALVDVSIDAATINTDNANRDKHLKGADFFDVEKYPSITFKSKKVMAAIKKGGKLKVLGDLTMHGVTRPVTLTVDSISPQVKGRGGVHMGIKASTRVNRQDFGVSWSRTMDEGGLMVANDVDVVFDLEVVKKAPEVVTPPAGR
ncbi:MAG TPA: YceI family protein [Thermoanaerobaculia bacterium]|nr:YceI family protein [Thermoanaerobaculia bacterium]